MLSRSNQLLLKSIHLLFISLTFGGLALIFSALMLKIASDRFFQSEDLDRILFFVNNKIIFHSVWGILFTALSYALFTKRGFLLYHWIIAKWILFASLGMVFIYMIIPAVNGMTSLSDTGIAFNEAIGEYREMIRLGIWGTAFALVIMMAVYFISVFKPWAKRSRDLFKSIFTLRLVLSVSLLIGLFFFVMNNIYLNRLRNMPVSTIEIPRDTIRQMRGVFEGGGGQYEVLVHVEAGKIKKIDFETDRKSKYLRFAQPTLQRIMDKQDLPVDAVTGATTTSKCIMKAVENAFYP
jgi:uncharacterized protein with FMN-binding domain